MPERTVKILAHSYKELVTDPAGKKRMHVRVAHRGETVELSEEEAARGDELGSFLTGDEEISDNGKVVDENAFDATEAGEDELIDWIENQDPTVKETVEAAGGDPDVARRILDAEEEMADPRKGVIKGLGAILNRDQ